VWTVDIVDWIWLYSNWNILLEVLQHRCPTKIIAFEHKMVNWHNGNFYWHVMTEEWHNVPFLWDKLYYSLWKKVTDVRNLNVNSLTWNLYWEVKLKDNVWYEFDWWALWNRLKIYSDWNDISSTIEKAYRLNIQSCVESYIQPDWVMAGCLMLFSWVVLPFQWNRLVKTISWKDIYKCADIRTLPDWRLAWEVVFDGDTKWFSFEWDDYIPF
jgi:hypothetical protein